MTLMSLVIVVIGLAGMAPSRALEACVVPYPVPHVNLCVAVTPPAADGDGGAGIGFYTYDRNHVYAGVVCSEMENDSVRYGYKIEGIAAEKEHHIDRQVC